jgi:TonB dependent receptor/TonB-dependent Receptor Plug Domain
MRFRAWADRPRSVRPMANDRAGGPTTRSCAVFGAVFCAIHAFSPSAAAQSEPEPPAVRESLHQAAEEVIEIEGRPPAESASSVHFDADDLRHRPRAQPSDVLRQAPGLVVSQHAGGGKADQYFLRGFDADHGTDVALFVDGVPVNLTSHGHGQGYADAHWIIPETIASLDVHKGPYAARYGDFYTAGAIEMKTIESIPGAGVWLTGGTEIGGPVAFERPTSRMLGMASPQLGAGKTLLAAELSSTDGPFLDQQNFRRYASLGRWTAPLGGGDLGVALTAYGARWNQSGQIPAAEVAAGRLDRFGSLDPSEGGTSSRASLALRYDVGKPASGRWSLHAYLVDYRLRLYSNFTLFARDPVAGDQIEQTDDRLLYGTSATYRRLHSIAGRPALVSAGVQARADDVTADLWHTSARQRLADCFEVANPCNRTDGAIRGLGAFIEEDISAMPWLQLIAGLRFDHFVWDLEDLDDETALTPMTTGGSAQRAIISPKLSAIVRPAASVDLFANAGFGFHSNDARAAVASGGPGALARAFGTEVGARARPLDSIETSAALWFLRLSSEQVWSGDAGGTEPSEATRRYGADLSASWKPMAWLTVDANVSLARSRFVANRGNAGALALAPRLTGGAGVTFTQGASFAALRARGIGDRPANDEDTLTAEGYLLLDLVAGYRLDPFELGVSITNLLDASWREAQFAEESRVAPEADLREDVHFTPGAPLSALVTVGATL